MGVFQTSSKAALFSVAISLITAGSTYTIPKGIYYARCGPYTRVDFYDGAAWTTVISTGGAGLIISDGSNVQAYNTSSSASDYIKLRPFT